MPNSLEEPAAVATGQKVVHRESQVDVKQGTDPLLRACGVAFCAGAMAAVVAFFAVVAYNMNQPPSPEFAGLGEAVKRLLKSTTAGALVCGTAGFLVMTFRLGLFESQHPGRIGFAAIATAAALVVAGGVIWFVGVMAFLLLEL